MGTEGRRGRMFRLDYGDLWKCETNKALCVCVCRRAWVYDNDELLLRMYLQRAALYVMDVRNRLVRDEAAAIYTGM